MPEWIIPVIPALRALRQEGCKIQASLGYIERPCLKRQTTTAKKKIMNAQRPHLDLGKSCLRFGVAHSQIHRLRTWKTLKCLLQEILTLTIQPHVGLRNVISSEDENNSQILFCYAPLGMELSNHKMEVAFCYSFWLPVLTTVTFGYIILKTIIKGV